MSLSHRHFGHRPQGAHEPLAVLSSADGRVWAFLRRESEWRTQVVAVEGAEYVPAAGVLLSNDARSRFRLRVFHQIDDPGHDGVSCIRRPNGAVWCMPSPAHG
jgi:hypothetical protein